MSEPKVYIITNNHSGEVVRYVRAYTLNSAVRAYAEELLTAKTATSGEMFNAFKNGFEVLDAIEAEQTDIIDDSIKPIEITGHEFAGTEGELEAYRELVSKKGEEL